MGKNGDNDDQDLDWLWRLEQEVIKRETEEAQRLVEIDVEITELGRQLSELEASRRRFVHAAIKAWRESCEDE